MEQCSPEYNIFYLRVFPFSVFENKEKMVLVMEIAAGGELYDYLSEKKCLEEREAKRIFRQGQILPNFFRR
jgi:serine/threonine protein kinase